MKIHYGVSREQGGRDYQQDEYTCLDNFSTGKGPAYFAIFDGHGSDKLAAFASSHLHDILFATQSYKSGDYCAALREGIKEGDKQLYENFSDVRGGCTATVCLVDGKSLYIGNLGDSTAVLGTTREGKVVAQRLSRDHKPDDKDELQRIQQAGGVVMGGRVCGDVSAINMSRAMGDFAFKTPQNQEKADWIASEPFIAPRVDMQSAHRFVVLASDGLWNVADDNTVVAAVDELYNSGYKPDDIAKQFVSRCAKRPGSDNVTVIVVFFDHEGNMFNGDNKHMGEKIISEHHPE